MIPKLHEVLNMSDAQLTDSFHAAYAARAKATTDTEIMAAHDWIGMVGAERRHRSRVSPEEAARMSATRVYLGGNA
jgi:hypothetical protein